MKNRTKVRWFNKGGLRNKKKTSEKVSFVVVVPKEGLEPSRLATHAPETCASTNSATSVSWLLQLRASEVVFKSDFYSVV